MKQLLENFKAFLGEQETIEFGEEEINIAPDTAENTANFCKGKQNGTQVPQEIVNAVNPGQKSKYVCFKQVMMSAERASKYTAGTIKEPESSVKPRTMAEAIKQDKEIRAELGLYNVFTNIEAGDEYKDAVAQWKKKPYKYVCAKYGESWVYKSDEGPGFKVPEGDKCKLAGQRELWHKCSGDKCTPVQPHRDCGAKCLAHKKKDKPKPRREQFEMAMSTDMPLNVTPLGKIRMPLQFVKPFYIPPYGGRWQAAASDAAKFKKLARSFSKATGLTIFPAMLAPGATVDKPLNLRKGIDLFAAKSIVKRTTRTRTPVDKLSDYDRRQLAACKGDRGCMRDILMEEEKTLMPKGQVYKIILVRDDKEGIKILVKQKQDWPE